MPRRHVCLACQGDRDTHQVFNCTRYKLSRTQWLPLTNEFSILGNLGTPSHSKSWNKTISFNASSPSLAAFASPHFTSQTLSLPHNTQAKTIVSSIETQTVSASPCDKGMLYRTLSKCWRYRATYSSSNSILLYRNSDSFRTTLRQRYTLSHI